MEEKINRWIEEKERNYLIVGGDFNSRMGEAGGIGFDEKGKKEEAKI